MGSLYVALDNESGVDMNGKGVLPLKLWFVNSEAAAFVQQM
jgi:hypothetical protein